MWKRPADMESIAADREVCCEAMRLPGDNAYCQSGNARCESLETVEAAGVSGRDLRYHPGDATDFQIHLFTVTVALTT